MATETYWLTYRIKRDVSYDDRYARLLTAVDAVGNGYKKWLEPTSFIAFASDRKIDDIAMRLKSAINQQTDLVLVGMPNFKSARVVGLVEDPDLFALIDFVKKV